MTLIKTCAQHGFYFMLAHVILTDMKKPNKVLCKRSLVIGEPFYYDETTGDKIERDNRVLFCGDWYDVVFNPNDNNETFSIIDNQNNRHLFWMYDDDTNHKLPRTYAKWFYTPNELEIKKARELALNGG